MNNDLISREALKKACSEMVRGSNNSDFVPCPSWNDAMELIDNAPTVEPEKICVAKVTFDVEKLREIVNDVVEQIKSGEIVLKEERPHGKWISKDKVDGHMFGYSCSNCRNPEWQITRFCPNCGAKMDKEADNEID